MAEWFRKLLFKPVLWASNKFASRPNKDRVFAALSKLHQTICCEETKLGLKIPFTPQDRFIIFSDQHKGAANGADDFMLCAPNYLAALDQYYQEGFSFIALGDCEELWENTLSAVKKHQTKTFAAESKFAAVNRLYKLIGNHDLYWSNDPLASLQVKEIFGCALPIYEGLVLSTEVNGRELQIFCTHGHQGDAASDGNWFSKFFVSRIWAPLQSLVKINPNTPAYDAQLKTIHNAMMYAWSAEQKDLLLITGHTHQPVFASLTHIERLYAQLLKARESSDQDLIKSLQEQITQLKFTYDKVNPDYLSMKPVYFNSGCCCFNDGDITGIEIEGHCLRLVKWHSKRGTPERMVLEESAFDELSVK